MTFNEHLYIYKYINLLSMSYYLWDNVFIQYNMAVLTEQTDTI